MPQPDALGSLGTERLSFGPKKGYSQLDNGHSSPVALLLPETKKGFSLSQLLTFTHPALSCWLAVWIRGSGNVPAMRCYKEASLHDFAVFPLLRSPLREGGVLQKHSCKGMVPDSLLITQTGCSCNRRLSFNGQGHKVSRSAANLRLPDRSPLPQ